MTSSVTKTANPLPFQTGTTASGDYLLKALLFTAILLAVCYGLLWLGRRYGLIRVRTGTSRRDLELIESLRVNVHTCIHAVQFQGRTFLLTESSRQVSLQPLDGDADAAQLSAARSSGNQPS